MSFEDAQDRRFAQELLESLIDAVQQFSFFPGKNEIRVVEVWVKHFLRWRGRKVTGLEDPAEIGVKILGDSFSFCPEVTVGPGWKCIDVGSGNGWPGLAFKMVQGDCEVMFLDSRLSAARFLENLCQEREIGGLSVLWARAEEAAHEEKFRETFDVACSRAMAEPFLSLEFSAGFVRVGGCVLLWLGPEEEARIGDLNLCAEILGLGSCTVKKYELYGGMGKRLLCTFRKVEPTRDNLPRKITQARKKSLIEAHV